MERKFFVDDAYDFLVKQIVLRTAWLLNAFDGYFINGIMVNQTSYRVLNLGKALSRLQNGQLQTYLSMAIGLGAAAVYFLMKGKIF